MSEGPAVPSSLFHTGRAQCPDCGAALSLLDHRALVQCQYCGGTATVERRLRTLEPVISEGLITADAPLGAAREIKPPQVINAVAQDEFAPEPSPRPCVLAMVRSRGDGLPEEIRRAFLRKAPESEFLTKLAVKYSDGSSGPRGKLDQKLEEWRAMWDAGIREVVEVYRERQGVAREYLK